MTLLDAVLPAPRLLEEDVAEVEAPVAEVWRQLRHGDLARSRVVKALFWIRTLPDRLVGRAPEATTVRIDDLVSSPERPGFQILAEEPGEFVVGAIGKVYEPRIPFAHVRSVEEFRAFSEPDYIKVAWSVRVEPLGAAASRIVFQLRVDATDESAWQKFRVYFRVIGPASHFIRRSLLAGLARELGTPEAHENERALDGDDLLPDASDQLTHGITIQATPETIWPWLLQMGCRRAGFYSVDALDNRGVRSARELHPELTRLEVGQILPATPDGEDGFEVLRIQAPDALVLGGLFDPIAKRQLSFSAARPERYWHVTWAFVLDPVGPNTTRLIVRARAAFSPRERLHAAWIRPVHHFMQTAQLRHLARRAEGTLAPDDYHDVLEGLGGAGRMVGAFVTPFLRSRREHWGVSEAIAQRRYPGDDLIVEPRWSWTHGVEIEAPVEAVWPWIAQVGSDRAGFYSYQWLENLAGCRIQNAEVVHPEWQIREEDALRLHPEMPPMTVADIDEGHYFVVHAAPPTSVRSEGKPWAAASWLFYVEPIAPGRTRFVSRYRVDYSDDVASRLSFGPLLMEPVGFAMDRKMLLGVKERSERTNATP